MAFEIVNPLTAFWRAQGLKHLLCSGEQISKTQTAEIAPAAFESDKKINSAPIFKKREEEEAEQAPRISAGEVRMPSSPCQWSEIWRKRLEKTRKAKIVWTYWELGPDLDQMEDAQLQTPEAAQARAGRSQLLKKLLKELNHPAGTHTFWPCALREKGEWTANPQLFWSGLHELKSRGVIIFGGPAVKALLDLDHFTPFTRMRIYSQFVWIMWDLENLMKDEQTARRFVAYMKEALKPFV